MISLLGALALGFTPCQSATPAPQGPAFTSKLRTLVVFKEGFAFYVREGTAKLENGWATTNLVPSAVAGTFWVFPKNKEDRLDTIVLTPDNVIDFDKPEDLRTSLANKIGLPFAITTDTGQVEGKLTNLLEKMLLIQDAKQNYVAIEYGKIKSVTLTDYPVKIKMRTAHPNEVADLGLAYVQEGVRWSPTYTLELNGDTGRLTLRGTLLNLDEPLKDANLVFVVGAPSLVNRGTIDDLLAGFVRSPMGPGGMGGGGFGQSVNGEGRRGGSGEQGLTFKSDDSATAVPIITDETGELQYYTKPNFSLRPGERAMTTIFETEIPVHPLFDWDADGTAVQYILTLDNKSKQPFTTGPVFVIDGERPVGQQVIPYTPPGSKTELKLAQGIGLRVDRRESELSRGEPFKIGDDSYIPIKLRGVLTLTNYRNEHAEVRVHRTVVGKLLDAGSGTSTNVDGSRTGPSTTTRLEWKLSIPAGKTEELTYSYEAYNTVGK